MADVIHAPKTEVSKSSVLLLMKYFLYAFLLFIPLLLLLGWAASNSGAGSESGGAVNAAEQSITLALSQNPPEMNSTKSTDMVSGMILGHVMEGLIRYSPDNETIPGIAESWEMSELGGTFHLRNDAYWSNGTQVTAHDFVFAWRTVLEPDTVSQYSFILYPLKNAQAINQGEAPVESLGATAVDDFTLRIELEQPTPYFVKLLAFFTYLPINQEFYESTEGNYGTKHEHLIYNGPFVIDSWVHDANLSLNKNDYYWAKEEVKLDSINYAYITADPNTTVNLFDTGKIAFAGLNNEANLEKALKNRWPRDIHRDGSVFYLGFNHRPERLTANRNLRKAIQFASDPSELVNKVLRLPGNLPGESIFPVWLKGVSGYFRDEYPAPKHIPSEEKAREHLELAMAELGLDSPPVLDFLTGDSPVSSKMAEYYQSLFKLKLGIDLRINQQTFAQRLELMTSGDYDIVGAGWGPDYDDVLTFGDLFTSWNANNRGQYRNSELDRNVLIAQQSSDPKTRMDAMDQVQKIIYEDAAIIVEYERGSIYVIDERIKGETRRAVGTDPDFTRAYIEE